MSFLKWENINIQWVCAQKDESETIILKRTVLLIYGMRLPRQGSVTAGLNPAGQISLSPARPLPNTLCMYSPMITSILPLGCTLTVRQKYTTALLKNRLYISDPSYIQNNSSHPGKHGCLSPSRRSRPPCCHKRQLPSGGAKCLTRC